MRSTKPLKTFCFSRPRKFRIRVFQCYERLAADFVRAFFSMTFSRRWVELGHCFSLPNNSRYHKSSFLENQIPITERPEHLLRPRPKNYASSGALAGDV
jgi:hypothetical protein